MSKIWEMIKRGRYDFTDIINYDILMKHEITNFHKYDVYDIMIKHEITNFINTMFMML